MPNLHMRWTDRFDVGIAELDVDHRAMHRQINMICCTALSGDRDGTRRQLAALTERAAAHFEREKLLEAAVGGDLTAATGSVALRRDALLIELAVQLDEEGAAFDLRKLPSLLIDWFCKQTIGHDAWIRACFHRPDPTLPRSDPSPEEVTPSDRVGVPVAAMGG